MEPWRPDLPINRPTIIIDTNFLLISIRFKVDFFKELKRIFFNPKIVVPQPVVDEIIYLGNKSNISRKEYNFTLKLLERIEILSVECIGRESVDDLIVRLSVKNNYIVGTTDKLLKKRLRAKAIPVVYMKNKALLEVEGYTKYRI